MSRDSRPEHSTQVSATKLPEIELSDEDILDAMRQIPGYLDISTEDFRLIYHRAFEHAVQRLVRGVRAERLMRTDIEPLRPDLPLDQAAAAMVRQRLKSLPVVDPEKRVVGILTETDVLRRLEAASFLELLPRLMHDANSLGQRWQASTVAEAMTASVTSVGPDAGYTEIMATFRAHQGRSMPVADDQGRLLGLLLRKDFIHASHLEGLL